MAGQVPAIHDNGLAMARLAAPHTALTAASIGFHLPSWRGKPRHFSKVFMGGRHLAGHDEF